MVKLNRVDIIGFGDIRIVKFHIPRPGVNRGNTAKIVILRSCCNIRLGIGSLCRAGADITVIYERCATLGQGVDTACPVVGTIDYRTVRIGNLGAEAGIVVNVLDMLFGRIENGFPTEMVLGLYFVASFKNSAFSDSVTVKPAASRGTA